LLHVQEWDPIVVGLALCLFGLLVEAASEAAGRGWSQWAALTRAAAPSDQGAAATHAGSASPSQAPASKLARAKATFEPGLQKFRRVWREVSAVLVRPRVTLSAAVLGWLGFGSALGAMSVRLFRRGVLPSGELGLWHAVLGGSRAGVSVLEASGWPEALRGMWFHPTAWLLVPFARWDRSAETLLVLRALASAAGGLFLWAMAERRLSGGRLWLLLGAFFLWPAWQATLLSDFSLVPFAVTFVLAGLAAWSRGEELAAWVAFLLALGCGEEGLALVLCLGVGAVIAGRRRRAGLLLVVLGVLGTAAIARFGARTPSAPLPLPLPLLLQGLHALWIQPASTVSDWVSAERLDYLLQIVAPLALLPLRGAGAGMGVGTGAAGGLVLLPGALLLLASTSLDRDFSRAGLFVAFVAPALAVTLAKARRARVVSLLVTGLVATVLWGLVPARREIRAFPWLAQTNLTLPPEAADRQRQAQIDETVRGVVPGLLLVPAAELAHVRPPRGVHLGMLSGAFAAEANSLLVGALPGLPGGELLAPAQAAGFRLVKTVGPWILLAR